MKKLEKICEEYLSNQKFLIDESLELQKIIYKQATKINTEKFIKYFLSFV